MASAPIPVPCVLAQPSPALQSVTLPGQCPHAWLRLRRAFYRAYGRLQSARRSLRRSCPCCQGSADRRRRRQRFTAGVWFGVNVNQAHFSGRKRALRQRFRVTVGQPFSSPQFTSRSGSQTSSRPAPKPKVRKPEFSSATLPARINRSAQRFLSVFLLNWPQQTASLIQLTLSGRVQRRKTLLAAPAPPRPSTER